ncbi:hypothetical protein PVAP13_6NG049330 [Panicum virgatum]|uniref:Uncharacterized protein n=1 Tax=Panicum virgatum TaxID=38727 RepID=A0A8T0QV68_PANVG|nr:hypothetical protein PVAP13_6NG049330 [Panicum virgatum]
MPISLLGISENSASLIQAGEELSKKQAAQEATIGKLRAQAWNKTLRHVQTTKCFPQYDQLCYFFVLLLKLVRELEEEKQRLNSKIQVEETKVEITKRDKAATEKLLQETIETELAAQKEFYTSALNAAKEAEALAEARVNSEATLLLLFFF